MKNKRYYCEKCLVKFRQKMVDKNDPRCPHCNEKAKLGSNRSVVQILHHARKKTRFGWANKKRPSYEAYLSSDLWKVIRKRILERDIHVCLVCKKTAQVVHHKSYAKKVLDGKADEFLVSLCHKCHEAIEFGINDKGDKFKNNLKQANEKLTYFIRLSE